MSFLSKNSILLGVLLSHCSLLSRLSLNLQVYSHQLLILFSFSIIGHDSHSPIAIEALLDRFFIHRFPLKRCWIEDSRDFRSKLHKYYQNLGGTIAMKRSKPYEGVTQQNSELICDWFEDPDFKEKTAKNKESRKAQVINHCAGSVSFARLKAKREAMVTHQAEAPTENSTTLNEDDIATQVLGTRPGYNRGLGHGFMPPSSESRRNSVVDDLKKNVDEANRHLEDAERRNEESERCNEELRMKVYALQSWQAQMQSFMSQFVPNASTCAE